MTTIRAAVRATLARELQRPMSLPAMKPRQIWNAIWMDGLSMTPLWSRNPGTLSASNTSMRQLSILFLALAFTTRLFAASPAEEWRTIETRHFRVHYPAPYEEWATRAAGRLESIRDAVAKEVGFAPERVIDVVVMNPDAELNGFAWPFLDDPRMILYTEPPGGNDQFGAYEQWSDLLAVHETAHMVHMLRPSRSPWARAVEKLVVPISPITLGSPRWVLEGYATVVEGRLTGGGRPNSTMRALILRRWAASGRLPTYEQLDSDRRFLGMRMAYLVGSAYLEWLERRSGPDALRKLWSALTARRWPEFSEAFTDVFGERPDRLYGQFTAELTASAMAIERGAELREGELFQMTSRATGEPAASPDGTQLAIVVRQSNQPQQLVVWSTGPPTEEEKKEEERIAKILARDPQDVRPVRSKPLTRKRAHTLVMPDAGDIATPRWTRDGKALVFAHRLPDAEGVLHWDLYRWDFERLTRITHLADVRDADPLPDGRTAIAVRSRFGKTQLVNVDLTTGAVTDRTQLSLDAVRVHPRVSPDGKRVAHVVQRPGARALVIDDRELTLPGDPASPEWISNDELVVTLYAKGFAELHRVRVNGTFAQITTSAGGAFDAAPAADGRVFFMSLEPDGYVVRVLPPFEPMTFAPMTSEPVTSTRTYDATLVPALPPIAPVAPTFTTESVTSRPYGIGRQEFAWFSGTNVAPDHQALELGIRFGDVVGRLDTLLIGSIGKDDAPSGIALTTAWRGWPVAVQAHAFHVDDDDSGLELRGIWTRRFPQSRLTVEGGALSDDRLFAAAAFSAFQALGKSRVSESLRVDVDDDHYRASAAASYRGGSIAVGLRYQIDRGAPITLGGLPSSVLPRSAYAHRVLDTALPAAILAGDDYDGWRVEVGVARPVVAFYQRHEVGATRLSLAGLEATMSMEAMPIVKFPGLDLTAGVARVLDSPLEGDTRWWLSMRWRP